MLRVREFRALWLAGVQSLFGDQLARVALSLLVFDREHSRLLTAAVYSLTYLPAIAGSLVLGALADRLPRRALLVCADLARAGLIATMAIPALPLGVVAGLLAVAVVVGTPWKAAESAIVADILQGRGYALGAGLRVASVQGTQLAGFALGGVIVEQIGSNLALVVDAATFVVSALVIRLAVTPRPAAGPGPRPHLLHGSRLIARDRTLRNLLSFSLLAGLFVEPEGLAAPYARALGGGARTTGLLLAAGPAGVLVGSLVLVRLFSRARRGAAVAPLAIAAGIPLVVCWWRPGTAGTAALWAASGLCSAYQVQVATEFVEALAASVRGQAIAAASSGLLAVQGVGLLLGGVAAQIWSEPTAVAVAGGAGIALAATLAVTRRSLRSMASIVEIDG